MDKDHKKYWDDEASKFDAIYSGEKTTFSHFLDKIFRKDMFERLEFTIKESEPVENRSFLDVGCGSGRYCLELCLRGARKVVGIDISPPMIDLAKNITKEHNCESKCEFIVGEIFNYKSNEIIDITLGLGLFDYVKEPLPLLKKMRELTKDKVILSFPRPNTWRAPVRKIRLSLKGYVVYFFTKKKIQYLMTQAGFKRFKIEKIRKLYCVVGYCD